MSALDQARLAAEVRQNGNGARDLLDHLSRTQELPRPVPPIKSLNGHAERKTIDGRITCLVMPAPTPLIMRVSTAEAAQAFDRLFGRPASESRH